MSKPVCKVTEMPIADTAATTACGRRQAMRDITTELKNLRLYGMAGAWDELLAQGESAGLQSASWLVEHLLDIEHTDRAMRSISYQLHSNT